MEEVLGTENIRKEAISFIYVKSHQDLGSLLHQSLLLNPEGPQITNFNKGHKTREEH